MDRCRRRRCSAVVVSAKVATLGLFGVAGCESYERSPLDVEAHRVMLERRADDLESIEAFVARLAKNEAHPGRIKFLERVIERARSQIEADKAAQEAAEEADG